MKPYSSRNAAVGTTKRSIDAGEVMGEVLPDNTAMLGLARQFGFKSRRLPDGDAVEVRLSLRDTDGDG